MRYFPLTCPTIENNSLFYSKKAVAACRKTCFGNQARAGFLFENKKTGGKSSEMSGVFSRNLDRLPPSGAGWRSFHFQVASFFRFMAANLSFTQFVTWAKPLYCV